MATRRWKCAVCGYIHKGDEPPEKCPACGAEKSMFVEIDEEGNTIEAQQEEIKEEKTETGESKAEETVEEVKQEEEVAVVEETEEKASESAKEEVKEKAEEKPSWSFLNWIGRMVLKFHLHPIAVHIPNGVLPMAVIFMVLTVIFNFQSFELTSFYSLAFVLSIMPVVVITGYLEWQMRYNGVRSLLFITKIFSALVVLGTVSTLVIWRLIDPGVAAPESPARMTYLIVGLVALFAAGIAGHLGGKLVFGRTGE